MTPEQLRRIDALVAEKVMGWHLVDNDWLDAADNPMANAEFVLHDDETWNPSTLWDDAGQVVEKMVGDGWAVNIAGEIGPGKPYDVRYWKARERGMAFAATGPLAVSLAALSALGVDVSEFVTK